MKEFGRKLNVVIPVDVDGYLFSDDWNSGYSALIRRRLAAEFTGWQNDHTKIEQQLDGIVQALRADDRN
jgi:hypothetical protein